jgi:uncharacterized coiled-coil DUF342 family protein
MTTTTFPASPQALFAAVYETYKVIDTVHEKREEIKDKLRELSQQDPYPQDEGRLLLGQLNQLNMKINGLNEKAAELNQVAMLSLLKSSDVANASSALKCTIGKCKLALDSLAQFENFLALTTSFLIFITNVSIAASSAPIGFLSIANLIKELDSIITMELTDTLSPVEIKEILAQIRKDCTKAT